MVAEAATVEAVWVVEPPLLEHLLDQEVSAYCSETVSACPTYSSRVSRRVVSRVDEIERRSQTITTPYPPTSNNPTSSIPTHANSSPVPATDTKSTHHHLKL